MRKSLRDYAKYLKEMIPEVPADYEISSIYESIADAKSIKNGVLAFKDFLEQFYDNIMEDSDLYDNPKPTTNRTGSAINLDYPFLRNIATLLMCIGVNGELNNNKDSLVINVDELITDLKKAHVTHVGVYLQYLTNCGIEFFSIGLDRDKPKLIKNSILEVSYPDNPIMLIGLKVMAKAQAFPNTANCGPIHLNGMTIEGIFLRCDYKALSTEGQLPIPMLKDVSKPFPVETQEFLLAMHQTLIDKGFKCQITNDRFSVIGYYFIYSYKNRPLTDTWTIRVTPDDCDIRINVKNAAEYANIIENFPLDLLRVIKSGIGCCNPSPCKIEKSWFEFIVDGTQYFKCPSGCCRDIDFWIPLTNLDSEGEIRREIENWVDLELSYLK